jgi:hypothetical protein
MTKNEILEKSRQELQGKTISEEDVKIRKERFFLNEDQTYVKSFYWSYIGFIAGYLFIAGYRMAKELPQDDLFIILLSTLTGLSLARAIFRKNKRETILAMILGITLIVAAIAFLARG